jgi:hypothetical protein
MSEIFKQMHCIVFIPSTLLFSHLQASMLLRVTLTLILTTLWLPATYAQVSDVLSPLCEMGVGWERVAFKLL